ncbi:MAG TPA: zinc ABC transporter substrate-binding protein [Chloroflexia bacterium]|nr:zinc ABC transporter substrate-binding protein [Chloroflexia bacterium]
MSYNLPCKSRPALRIVALASLCVAMTACGTDATSTPALQPATTTPLLATATPLAAGATNTPALPATPASAAGSGTVVTVVAAENFYGDIVQQLGGAHVAVTSILSDPNIDPHEYESNVQTAVAVTKAQIVIKNGGGYDDWMDKLLAAAPNAQRQVISGFDLAPRKLPNNEHVWYGFDNVKAIAQGIAGALQQQDGADGATFAANLRLFDQAVDQLDQQLQGLKARYNSTPVGLTETIYLYQSQPLGLQVLTPFEFEKAIAEGNDPPADTVAAANTQISQHQIKILIYNNQTVTPVTTNLENAAKTNNIPIVPVTETMPPGKSYQQWMHDQLNTLQQALQQSTGK